MTSTPIAGSYKKPPRSQLEFEAAIDQAIDALHDAFSANPGITKIKPAAPIVNAMAICFNIKFNAWGVSIKNRSFDSKPIVKIDDLAGPNFATILAKDKLDEYYASYAKTLRERLLEKVQSLLDTQAHRYRIALANGLGNYEGEQLSANHFVIDKSAALLLAEARINPGDLVLWHRKNSIDHHDKLFVHSAIMYSNSIPHVAVGLSPDYDAPALIPTITIDSQTGLKAHLSGRQFVVQTLIPETVLTASIGKPLGDIIATGIDHLDARIIEDANGRDAHTSANGDVSSRSTFTLQPERITIANAHKLASRLRLTTKKSSRNRRAPQ